MLCDYDVSIQYHPGKANVVADARSRKNHGNAAALLTRQPHILMNLMRMNVYVQVPRSHVLLTNLLIQPTLIERIRIAQAKDPQLQKIRGQMRTDKAPHFLVDEEGTLRLGKRACVPNHAEIRRDILAEAHESGYSIHPGETKTRSS